MNLSCKDTSMLKNCKTLPITGTGRCESHDCDNVATTYQLRYRDERICHRSRDEDPEHSAVVISLLRSDQIYRPNEQIKGNVIVDVKGGWKHTGIEISVCGKVLLALPPIIDKKNSPCFIRGTTPAMIRKSSDKSTFSLPLLEKNILLKPAGELVQGRHCIPFSFPLLGTEGSELMETFHGVYIKVVYEISIFIDRGIFQRRLEHKTEFVVEQVQRKIRQHTECYVLNIDAEFSSRAPVPLCHEVLRITSPVSPQSDLTDHGKTDDRPISITCALYNVNPSCSLKGPLTGFIVVEHSVLPLVSVDFQLMRVEGISKDLQSLCGGPNGRTLPSLTNHHDSEKRSVSLFPMYRSTNILRRSLPIDIVKLQMVQGDVAHNTPIPIEVTFPRLITCSTFETVFFSLDFMLNIICTFRSKESCRNGRGDNDNGAFVVTKCVPLILHR